MRFAAEFSLPINEGETLLGVQFDDQIFCNLEVNIVSCGQCDNLAAEGVLVSFQPLRSVDESVVFLHLLEAGGGAAVFADGDNVADIDRVGRNVDALAVDGVVAVVDQLTGLAAGGSIAKTVNNVVQSALDEAQQILAGVALHALGLLIEGVELLLENAVHEFDLLLLGQLRAVLRLLGSSFAAGIAVGLLGVAHGCGRNAERSAALQNRLCILCHINSPVLYFAVQSNIIIRLPHFQSNILLNIAVNKGKLFVAQNYKSHGGVL